MTAEPDGAKPPLPEPPEDVVELLTDLLELQLSDDEEKPEDDQQ